MTKKLLLLPGDGIGPEVGREAARIAEWFSARGQTIEIEEDLVGGAAFDAYGHPAADETIAKAKAADAVLLGAVGGPKWDGQTPYALRPEAGILRLRKDLGLFANLRPAMCSPALADASSLKREHIEGLDIMIVRELTGGVYFGTPRGVFTLPDGQRKAVNTQVYTTNEIRRLAKVGFDLARKRKGKVTSCEKANVMETGVLWREEVTKLHAETYTDVELGHMYADNAAMQLMRAPKQFDVIVTDNLFGDILSDAAAMATGSLGMLPSASLGDTHALYEPVHGSAPDIAGEGKANPLAMILSLAMCFRYTFDMGEAADRVEAAVDAALASGARTGDIAGDGYNAISTSEMGDAVIAELEKAV
ncbi:MAG: 3-isopropylmalate dehydrogenase [Pseudomonadota bacterium]